MIMGMVKVLRMYMGAAAEVIADAAGISIARYIDIENGYTEPASAEITKLAAVFGMDEDVLTGKSDIGKELMFRQPLDESVFATEELREMMKLRMTELSDAEKRLILLIRASEDSSVLLEKVMDIVSEDITAL